jgi:hypothetical protein
MHEYNDQSGYRAGMVSGAIICWITRIIIIEAFIIGNAYILYKAGIL